MKIELKNPCILTEKNYTSHREVLAIKLGRPIRKGYSACHHCDVKNCIEPEHLYEGTPSKNTRDAHNRNRLQSGWGLANSRKTHCSKGHPLSGDNLFIDSKGCRGCRECRRTSTRNHRSRTR